MLAATNLSKITYRVMKVVVV